MVNDNIIILKDDNIEMSKESIIVEPSEIPDDLYKQINDIRRNQKVAKKIIYNEDLLNIENMSERGSDSSVIFENNTTKNTSEEGDFMTNDNFELLFKELKEDMREREGRTSREIKEREERFEQSMNKYHQDNKEREERIYQLIKDIQSDNKNYKDYIKSEITSLKDDFKNTKDTVSNLTKHNESIATTNKWSNITTIIGISAIVVTAIIALLIS